MYFYAYNTDTGEVIGKASSELHRDDMLADGYSIIESEDDHEILKIKIVNGLITANTEYLTQMKADEIRQERNRLLAQTDWRALSDSTLTTEWAEYRQALRDVTSQTGFPTVVIWPEQP